MCVCSLLLQDFPQLTSLVVDHVDDEDAATLAHLTRLQALTVTAPNELTPYALEDLSKLKQLTRLEVYEEPVDLMDDEPPADTAVHWFLSCEVSKAECSWHSVLLAVGGDATNNCGAAGSVGAAAVSGGCCHSVDPSEIVCGLHSCS